LVDQLQHRVPPRIDPLHASCQKGLQEIGLRAEMVMQRRGVALTRFACDPAQRDSLQPVLTEQPLRRIQQQLPRSSFPRPTPVRPVLPFLPASAPTESLIMRLDYFLLPGN